MCNKRAVNAWQASSKRVANELQMSVNQIRTCGKREVNARTLHFESVHCTFKTQTHYTLYLIRIVYSEKSSEYL